MSTDGPDCPPASALEAPEHPAFRRLGAWVLRHRWALLALNLLISLGSIWTIAERMRMNLGTEPFLPADSTTRLITEKFKDDFGHDIYSLVLVEGDVFSPEYLKRLKALHQDLAAIDVEIPSLGQRRSRPRAEEAEKKAAQGEGDGDDFGAGFDDDFGDFGGEGWGDEGWGDEEGGSVFEEVTSLYNVRQTRGEQDGIVVEGLLDEWPDASELPALKERVLDDRSLVGRVVDRDASLSTVVLRTDHMDEQDSVILYDAIREVIEAHRAPGFEIQIAGVPAIVARLTVMTLEDLRALMAAAVVVMVLVLAWVFRHWLGVVGPIFAVLQSALWASGFQALLDKPWTQASNIIPAFVICVGIGDAVHIQSAYRNQLRAGVERREAIVRAVATTGVPVLYTTLTTFIGLFSFQFASADAVRDVGLFGGYGVVVAMLQCLVLVPIFLSFHKKGNLGATYHETHDDWMDRVLAACSNASSPGAGAGAGRRRAVIAVACAIALASVYEASTVYVSHKDLRHMPADDPARLATETADEALGGAGSLYVYIRALPGETLADRELMLGLEKLEQHILDYRDPVTGEAIIANVTSLLDVVRESHRALHGGEERAYRIPDTRQGVVDMLTLFQNSGPEELRKAATVDLTHSHMQVRAKFVDAARWKPLNAHILEGVERYIGDRAVVDLTGTGHMMVEVTNLSLRDLLRSFSVAFVAVTILMVVMLRSFKLGAIAMLPNLLPIAAVLGLMGLTNIWLDYSNVMIASIALGIVVDDTIHFLHQFRVQHEATLDVERSLAHAFNHSGRAMIITSLVLLCGFGVFGLAQLGNVRLFGLLVGATVIFALAVDLVLAPALLRTFYAKPRP